MDFAPHTDGSDAMDALHDRHPEWLYLPDDGVLLRILGEISAEALACFDHFILTDEAMRFTFVQPNKRGFGPYFCERT